jgi:type I restriction enzyme S subunit
MFVKSGKKVYEQKNAIFRNAEIGDYFIDEQKFRELKRFAVTPGEFIVSCAGTIGRVFRIPTTAQAGVINQALLKIYTNGDVINSDFFYHYFDWDLFRQRIVENTHGGAMQNLVGMNLFRSVELACPPLPEQHAIAEALSDVDALLDGLDRLIDKKLDFKQAAMQQLLTGQTRLPGFDGQWAMSELREVCTKIQDGTHFSPKLDGNDYLYLTSRNIDFGILNLSRVEMIAAAEHAKIYKRCDVRKGDLLLTKDGVNTGNCALNTLDEPFSLLSSVAFLRFDTRYHTPAFFLYQILSDEGQRQILDLMSGNAITRLTLAKIKSLRFAVPSFEEQTAIAEVLKDMDTEIAALEQRREKTRALKQAMMQELLTGKTRLI